MNKVFPSCFICLTLHLFSFAQSASKVDKEYVFRTAALVQKKVTLSPKTHLQYNFPNLEKIEVIDARSDSSCIGFKTRSSEKKNDQIKFTLGLKNEFEKFFNLVGRFNLDAKAYSVTLVVRDFWLNQFEVDADEKDKTLDNRIGSYEASKTTLRATFDIFLRKNNEYFVGYRFDTIATAFLDMKEFTDEYLPSVVQSSLAKLESIDPDTHIANKRKFTRDQLEEYYLRRWEKPILKGAEFQRGVYKNFSEFLNNRPTITQFVVKKDKLTDIIYITDDGGQSRAVRDVWGYCDGKNFFIKSGENYFMLVRVQNGFYFLGSKELINAQDEYHHYDNGMDFPTYSAPYLKNRLVPMRVDMEKGTAY
jgi:hypothetical protein